MFCVFFFRPRTYPTNVSPDLYDDTSLRYPEFRTDFNRLISIVLSYQHYASDVDEIGARVLREYYPSGKIDDDSHSQTVQVTWLQHSSVEFWLSLVFGIIMTAHVLSVVGEPPTGFQKLWTRRTYFARMSRAFVFREYECLKTHTKTYTYIWRFFQRPIVRIRCLLHRQISVSES